MEILLNAPDFDLKQSLCCGQIFTFCAEGDGFSIISGGRHCIAYQDGDVLRLDGAPEADREYWNRFFALDVDYAGLKRAFSADPTLCEAVCCAPGIRVLRQELWEATCSFIISQNNNIKRITGIVARLCEGFGPVLSDGTKGFPRPQALASLSPDELAPLRCGFRARYIIDAAQKFSDGSIDETYLRTAPLDDAAAMLMTITGVGVKVAACALLFGAARFDAFPQDVWIKRAMSAMFPDGLPQCACSSAGIAQQYIYDYARRHPEKLSAENADDPASL